MNINRSSAMSDNMSTQSIYANCQIDHEATRQFEAPVIAKMIDELVRRGVTDVHEIGALVGMQCRDILDHRIEEPLITAEMSDEEEGEDVRSFEEVCADKSLIFQSEPFKNYHAPRANKGKIINGRRDGFCLYGPPLNEEIENKYRLIVVEEEKEQEAIDAQVVIDGARDELMDMENKDTDEMIRDEMYSRCDQLYQPLEGTVVNGELRYTDFKTDSWGMPNACRYLDTETIGELMGDEDFDLFFDAKYAKNEFTYDFIDKYGTEIGGTTQYSRVTDKLMKYNSRLFYIRKTNHTIRLPEMSEEECPTHTFKSAVYLATIRPPLFKKTPKLAYRDVCIRC